MKKIQIKSIRGNVLFELEKENNTIKDTVEEAVRLGINLAEANLADADLAKADLRKAQLYRARLTGALLYSAKLARANLSHADLNGAILTRADLTRADMNDSNMFCAKLIKAKLIKTNLERTILCWADLHEAKIHDSKLTQADLNRANLFGADLTGSNLLHANVYGANFFRAKEIPSIPMACPTHGSFIGWTKIQDHLIMLEIPEDARRYSGTTIKCRCDKAKILEITDIRTQKKTSRLEDKRYNPSIIYQVGENIISESFVDDRWDDYPYDIHFFVDKEMALLNPND